MKREFATYIDLSWKKLYSNTADIARDEGAAVGDFLWLQMCVCGSDIIVDDWLRE